MEHSHIHLSFFVIITMVFVVSAHDGGYKILSYGEDFRAYPWQRVNHHEWVQRTQRRMNPTMPVTFDDWSKIFYRNNLQDINGTYQNKRKSNFEEQMADLTNFERNFKVKVIYGRVPVPVMLVPSYDKPKH